MPRLPVALLPAVSVAVCLVTAQTNTPGRTVWEGVYTDAQAARGATVFGQSCAGCHALANEGKAPLVGDNFWKSFSQKTVGELVEFVTLYMPNGNPKSLSDAAYQDIVAHMLKANGFPAGNVEIAPNAAAMILPRDGSTVLPSNALARVVGCLTRSGSDWVVTRATTPERAERERPAGDDASRPLGTRTMALKFVLTKLDSMAGARVAVNGLLIGAGGADGINVTTVNRLAPTCP